jgi:undecaprenyl-diphosphatase
MFSIDHTINILFSNNVDNFITSGAFYFASWLFNPVPFIILLIVSCGLIFMSSGKEETAGLFTSVAIAFLLSWALKLTVGVARPLHPQIYALGSSFPSAHTAVSTAYFLYLAHFLRWTHNGWRMIIHITFCVSCALFVGLSRLYFGVHWLSDVLVGYVIGALAVYVAIHYVVKWLHKVD